MTETQNESNTEGFTLEERQVSIPSMPKPIRVTVAEPKEQSPDAVPVLILPGFLSTDRTVAGSVREMAGTQLRSSLSPNLQEGVGRFPVHPGSPFPATNEWKAQVLIEILDALNIERADFIAHSEGAFTLAVVAAKCPKRIRNMILVSPSGMTGDRGFIKMLWRYIVCEGGNERRRRREKPGDGRSTEEMRAAWREASEYIGESPATAVRQVFELERYKIGNVLNTVIEDHPHIGIGILHGKGDEFYREKEIREEAERVGIKHIKIMKGDHVGMLEHPREYMAASEEMIRCLEEEKR